MDKTEKMITLDGNYYFYKSKISTFWISSDCADPYIEVFFSNTAQSYIVKFFERSETYKKVKTFLLDNLVYKDSK